VTLAREHPVSGTPPMSTLQVRLEKVQDLLRFFRVQRIDGFAPPTEPRLDPVAKEWLAGELRKAGLYLEFGAGGSTLLANSLGVAAISVESDRFYAATVRSALASPGACKILTPNMGVTRQWGMPLFPTAAKGWRYVSAPFAHLQGRFPDLIVVDGRYRVACALESARRAAEASAASTLLLDDYRDRSHYHGIEDHLGAPEMIGQAARFVLGERTAPEDAIRRYLRDPR
jgi:hypothetical protein